MQQKAVPIRKDGNRFDVVPAASRGSCIFPVDCGHSARCFPRSDLPWSPSWAVGPARHGSVSGQRIFKEQNSTELPYVPGSIVRPCSPAAQGDEAPYNKASHIFQFPRQHCRVSLHASESPFHAGKSSVFPDIQRFPRTGASNPLFRCPTQKCPRHTFVCRGHF